MRHLDGYRGEATLAAWLFTICRYEISAHFRRLGRIPSAVELSEDAPEVRAALDSLPAAAEGPEEDLRRKELGRRVHATLDRLPPRYGQALEWKYIQGYSVKEIAGRLNLSPEAAQSLLARAKRAFQDIYGTLARPVMKEAKS